MIKGLNIDDWIPSTFDLNGWKHLRTFKKYLFDAIRVEDLKLDGEWVSLPDDWAYMIPIVEMASHAVHIPETLYVYDPAIKERESHIREREKMIARIVVRPPYHQLAPRV